MKVFFTTIIMALALSTLAYSSNISGSKNNQKLSPESYGGKCSKYVTASACNATIGCEWDSMLNSCQKIFSWR